MMLLQVFGVELINHKKYNNAELSSMLKGKRKDAEKAFTFIYEYYSKHLYNYIFSITNSELDTNDIFQDVFTKFLEISQSEEHLDNIHGLLIRIARNICLNFKRDKKTTENIEDYTFTIEDPYYEDKELLEIIQRSLDLLEFNDREIFILKQYQGLTYQEIGDITNNTQKWVRNRYWRIKERVKLILEPYLKEF